MAADPIQDKDVYVHLRVTDAEQYRRWIDRHFNKDVEGMRVLGIGMDPSFFVKQNEEPEAS